MARQCRPPARRSARHAAPHPRGARPAGRHRGDLAASRRVLTKRATLTDLPPLVTATAGRPTLRDLGAAEPRKAKLMLEHGGSRDLTLMPARGQLRIPAVAETGYHRLEVGDREVVLAVAPPQCRTIDDMVPDARLWGVAAQVYALRSTGDGGIGDAAGIAELAEALAARGADALCLSPMHALFTADPGHFGPYSPSSRLFLNPLHAAPALVFSAEQVGHAMLESGLGEAFGRLEEEKLIDWPASSAAKLALLRALFDSFLDGPDAEGALRADFASFRADGGDLLHQHATFEALHADRVPEYDWRRWVLDLRDPDSAAVAAFAASRRDAVLFHEFLQWVADRSLAAAQARAHAAGMRIGLVGDLAVGMDPTGSHAWSRQRDILLGLAIGAPPDLFNPRGQDWGLTGFSPRALEDGGFVPFIATLRAVLRHAGGVRIDHVMGLSRLWLVPEGADPADGAYLAYPLTDLLRLLALEFRPARRRRGGRGPRHRAAGFPRDAEPGRRARHAGPVVRAVGQQQLRPGGSLGCGGAGDDHDARPAHGRGVVAWHRYRHAGGMRPARAGRHGGECDGRAGPRPRGPVAALCDAGTGGRRGTAERRAAARGGRGARLRRPHAVVAMPAAGRGFARAGGATEPTRDGRRAPELAAPAARSGRRLGAG